MLLDQRTLSEHHAAYDELAKTKTPEQCTHCGRDVELDEVCRVIDDLRREYHEDGMPIGTYDDRRSPYVILKHLLVEAYGPDFDVVYDRYRDKVRQRERRARRRAAEKELAA